MKMKPKFSKTVERGMERVLQLIHEDINKVTAGGVNERGYRDHGMDAPAWHDYEAAARWITEIVAWRRRVRGAEE